MLPQVAQTARPPDTLHRFVRLDADVFEAFDAHAVTAFRTLLALGWRELLPHGDEAARLGKLDREGRLSLIGVHSDGRFIAGGPRPQAARQALAAFVETRR
jgi:hypothetical protein